MDKWFRYACYIYVLELMNIYYFKIAGITFRLRIDHELVVNNNFKPFLVKEAEADCCIEFLKEKNMDILDGEKLFSEVGFDVLSEENHFVRQYVEQKLDRKPYAQGRISDDGKKVVVKYLPEFAYAFTEITNSFSHIGFDELLMHSNRMILHASLVKTEYGGILFSGPSKVGKSTQANLWKEYKKGEIINGDRPILGKADGIWYAWGSPYAGSSIYHKASKAQIRAIILLNQGLENQIEPVSQSFSFKNLYKQTTNNSWNKWYVSKVIDMVSLLAKEIPVYQLTCTPDKRAVDVVDYYLKGEMADESERIKA